MNFDWFPAAVRFLGGWVSVYVGGRGGETDTGLNRSINDTMYSAVCTEYLICFD